MYICPQTTTPRHTRRYISVLILLYIYKDICPHTATSEHTRRYTSVKNTSVLIIYICHKYVCPHPDLYLDVYVSSHYYISKHTRLYICPHTAIYLV